MISGSLNAKGLKGIVFWLDEGAETAVGQWFQ